MNPAALANALRELVGELGPALHPTDAVDFARVAERLELLSRGRVAAFVAERVELARGRVASRVVDHAPVAGAPRCYCGERAGPSGRCERCESARERHQRAVGQYSGERDDE